MNWFYIFPFTPAFINYNREQSKNKFVCELLLLSLIYYDATNLSNYCILFSMLVMTPYVLIFF